MTWIVTVHDGAGSMVEAADPALAFVTANETEAKQLARALGKALEHTRDGYHDRECWASCFEAVPPPTVPPPPGTPPGFSAVDAHQVIADWIREKDA